MKPKTEKRPHQKSQKNARKPEQEAPKSVDTFVKLIEGKLFATCMDEDMVYDEDAFGVSDR